MLKNIRDFCKDFNEVKIALESTGHYGGNLIAFLTANGFNITVLNPLQVNLYRKSQTLRKTKTDKADALLLAQMLAATTLPTYLPVEPEISELKALVRHRSRMVAMRTKLKVSYSRLVAILFPELGVAVSSIHQAACLALLEEYPTVKSVVECHLTKLTNLLSGSSNHRYGKDKALEIKALAAKSIGIDSVAVGFELQQTIRLTNNIRLEIDILDKKIKSQMLKINSPILTIPGISYTLGSMILAEIGNIENFDNPAKLLAFAGLDPAMYQSGKYNAANTPMVKRGSVYLRWALLQAALLASRFAPTFKEYATKKRNEGKHHFVVMSHTARKLVRVIFHLLKNNAPFQTVE